MDRGGLPLVSHLLQHTLRSLCGEAQWVYAVFWRILPRNYPPPKWDSDAGPFDRSKGNKRNWILVWEDGFCDFTACCRRGTKEIQQANDSGKEDGIHTAFTLQPELFFKMSHDVYNFGEGLIGKVAADSSHKWIYRDPSEHEITFSSPWQGSLDPHPRTWEAQFRAGIQTIAVVAVGEGLLQLGSLNKIVEDLNFVILLQRKFNYLQSIPGVFTPHPISEILGARKNWSRGRSDDDAGEEPAESSLRKGERTHAITNHLKYCNTEAGVQKPIFLQENQLLSVKRPLDADNPTCHTSSSFKLQAPAFPPLQSVSVSPQTANGLLNRVSPLSCSPLPALPSMSSLQALLSKLPPVTAVDHSGSSSYVPLSSVCINPCPARNYTDTVSTIASRLAQSTPPTTTDCAAAAGVTSTATSLSAAAMYAANCTTTGVENGTVDLQTRQKLVQETSASISMDWVDELRNRPGLEYGSHCPRSEMTLSDQIESGDSSNSLFCEIIS